MAQFGSALRSGRRGREFKSPLPDSNHGKVPHGTVRLGLGQVGHDMATTSGGAVW